MPSLNWIGKEAVEHHHKEVPYRLVHCDGALSAGDPDAGIRYRRFGCDLLMLDLVAVTSVKRLITANGTSSGSIAVPGKYKTISTVLDELDASMSDRFEALRAYLIALGDDDVQETTLRFYIAFKRIKNFACVEFRPTTSKILIYVKVDPSSLQIEKGFTRDVSEVAHFGTGDLEITLTNAEDLEKAKPLIERSYGAS